MTSLAASLALVVALGAGDGEARAARRADAGTATTNAERAKLGLLPRKAPARLRAARVPRSRVIHTSAPTYLGEPGTLADGAYRPPPEPGLRLAARGVVTDVTLSLRYDP